MVIQYNKLSTVNNYYNILYSYKFKYDSMVDLAELFLYKKKKKMMKYLIMHKNIKY